MKESFTPSISNSRPYCLTSAFFGLVRISTSAALVEVLQRRHHRQAADELGDQAEPQQILGLDLAQDRAGAALVRAAHLGAEADARALAAGGDDLLQARRRRRRR